MTRMRAQQINNEIIDCLDTYSKQMALNPDFGKAIVENYLGIFPDNAKRDIIFLGKNSSSYKLGNISLDLKNTLLALFEFVSAMNMPESYFGYVQLVMMSILCVGAMAKGSLDYNCATVVFILHKSNAYEIGASTEQIIDIIAEKRKLGDFKNFEEDKINETINELLKLKTIRMEEGKVYLNEKVWGKID